MTAADSTTYLAKGGYLQKGRDKNISAADLRYEVQDLLPGRYFRDEKIFELERRAIFSKQWHIASFTARFKNPGDYLALEMFGWSFFLIKDKSGNINAFHNICRHRGHPVITKSTGTSQFLTCRFHGWTYNADDGSLHRARSYTHNPSTPSTFSTTKPYTNGTTQPETQTLPGFNPSDHSLFKIHTHTTPQGFIFINFDSQQPAPHISFADQFGDDFDPIPSSITGQVIGDEYSLFPKQEDEWIYDHTWQSSTVSTAYNWKTFADGFQECYHCVTGHPTTLPKDFKLNEYYLRQGHGASRHFLPTSKPEEFGESYITWLYPIGAIIFSEELLFIARFDARGVLDTRYESETYRRRGVERGSERFDRWMGDTVGYWRAVETEDVELAVAAQRGFANGVLAKGRLHPVQEHAVKWYQDKVKQSLLQHVDLERELGKKVDYSIPQQQAEYDEKDPICQFVDSEELSW